MSVLSKILNRIKRSFNASRPRAFYILGVILFSAALALNYLLPNWPTLSGVLLLLASCLLMIGYCIWHIPFLHKIWEHELGKVAISVVHVAILLITTVFARNLITLSLGLPGKDFEISLSFLTLLLYIPVWLGVSSVVFGVGFYFLSLFISDETVKSSHSGHVLGSIGTLIIIYFLLTSLINSESLHSIVRTLAYYSDYESALNYPGTKPNERICFHENGVISSAWNLDGDIVISIRKTEGK